MDELFEILRPFQLYFSLSGLWTDDNEKLFAMLFHLCWKRFPHQASSLPSKLQLLNGSCGLLEGCDLRLIQKSA